MNLRRSFSVFFCLALSGRGIWRVRRCKTELAQTAFERQRHTCASGKGLRLSGCGVCKTCHEEIYNGWEKTPHWKTTLDTKGGPSHQGCEGCHGPGAAHVAGGGDKTKIFIFTEHSTKEINDRCLTCHAGGTEHMNAMNSAAPPE